MNTLCLVYIKKVTKFVHTLMKKKGAKYPIPIREWSEDDRPRD